jgi:hypothetical protein
MFSKKRKCNLSDLLKVQFSFIHLIDLEDTTVAKFMVCSLIFSIGNGRRTSLPDHPQAKKHKNALLAKSQSGCMTNYFRKLEP